jgi:hypothetical protein
MVRQANTKTKRASSPPAESAKPSSILPTYMSQAEYARHAGVHGAQVTRWIKMTKGSPLPHIVAAGKKKILVKEADVWRAGYLKPHVTAAKLRQAQKREIDAGQAPHEVEDTIERKMAQVRLREMELKVGGASAFVGSVSKPVWSIEGSFYGIASSLGRRSRG